MDTIEVKEAELYEEEQGEEAFVGEKFAFPSTLRVSPGAIYKGDLYHATTTITSH